MNIFIFTNYLDIDIEKFNEFGETFFATNGKVSVFQELQELIFVVITSIQKINKYYTLCIRNGDIYMISITHFPTASSTYLNEILILNGAKSKSEMNVCLQREEKSRCIQILVFKNRF